MIKFDAVRKSGSEYQIDTSWQEIEFWETEIWAVY